MFKIVQQKSYAHELKELGEKQVVAANSVLKTMCSDPVVVHTAVTTSVVPRSIGG